MTQIFNPFQPSLYFEQRLQHFNKNWEDRLRSRWQLAPIWEFGGKVTPEIRGRYETFAPIQLFFNDLRILSKEILPDANWIPRILFWQSCGMIFPDSLPDFLNSLPESLQPLLPITFQKLCLLLCHLADPLHFGTESQRYPLQQQQFQECLKNTSSPTLKILDLGCGTGQGTYEIAHLLEEQNFNGTLHGITLEQIEVWIATTRYAPHRKTFFPQHNTNKITCQFQAADIFLTNWENEKWNFIFCNGLIGGPICNRPQPMLSFFTKAQHALTTNGKLFLANSFHQGYQNLFTLFIEQTLKTQSIWQITGTSSNLVLQLSQKD